MTRLKTITKDRRYREFRQEQLRKLRINEGKTMRVPEHSIWNMLIDQFERIQDQDDVDLLKDDLVDIANLCLLCHMSIEGFKHE